MSEMKKDIKRIIENSKTEEDLLDNLDQLNRPLTEEELSFVIGGIEANLCGEDACGSDAAYMYDFHLTFDDECGLFAAVTLQCGVGGAK